MDFWEDLLKRFSNASIGAAMAENPSVMTASGWKKVGDSWKQESSKGSEQLKDNLAVLSSFSPTHPVSILFEKGLPLVFKAGKVAKNGFSSINPSSSNTSGRIVTPEQFYSSDVVPRSFLRFNNPIQKPLKDFSFRRTTLPEKQAGFFNRATGEVVINNKLAPFEDSSTRVHEFRHKLDEMYKRIQPQNQLLESSYKVYSGAANKGSSLLEEKMATNTELRYQLFNDFTQKYGRIPTVQELNKYIDNLSVKDLSSKLYRVNGYGQDYVGTFKKWIDRERKAIESTADFKRNDRLNNTINSWEQNIKTTLKYVPVGAGLLPKKKNTQPGK